MGKMRIWYDEEGDYLEFGLTQKKGYFKDAGDDIWERVDERGHILGLAILNFKKRMAKNKTELKLPVEVVFQG